MSACTECGKDLGILTESDSTCCKGCMNKFVVKDLFSKTILPIALAAFLLYMAYLPLKSGAVGFDLYMKMFFFAGIPFGLKKMCSFIVPFGHGVSATVAIFALNFIVGGVIGAFVLVWRIIYALFNLIKSVTMLIQIAGSVT